MHLQGFEGHVYKYGFDRIQESPIFGTDFTGIEVIAGQRDLKPIIEFMTWNYSLQAIGPIISSGAKIHYNKNW